MAAISAHDHTCLTIGVNSKCSSILCCTTLDKEERLTFSLNIYLQIIIHAILMYFILIIILDIPNASIYCLVLIMLSSTDIIHLYILYSFNLLILHGNVLRAFRNISLSIGKNRPFISLRNSAFSRIQIVVLIFTSSSLKIN